jgi:AcrR family transcriptional regulator
LFRKRGDVSLARTDRRVRRTRDLLQKALLSLIKEKGYDSITIRDILERADVGRSTFYMHYRDKDDLFRSGFEDIRAALAVKREEPASAAEGEGQFLQPVLAVFRHVDAHRYLWTPVARKGGADLVIRTLRENATGVVREHFLSQFPAGAADQREVEAAIQFAVGALMGLLTWWLEEDAPYPWQELYAIFRQLATQGVQRFLATS